MRKDMHKILVERPRYGSSLPSMKTGMTIRNYDPEEDYAFPKRMSSARRRQYGYNARMFGENLAPLRRLLQKRVGRPWSKVYSEIIQGLDTRKVIGRHVLSHVRWEVAEHCVIGKDGMAYDLTHGTPVRGLYVHPRTGLLKKTTPSDWWRNRYQDDEKKEPHYTLNATIAYRMMGGIWYIEFYEDLDPEEIVETWYDRLTKRDVHIRRKDQSDASLRKMVHRKQANKKELRVLPRHHLLTVWWRDRRCQVSGSRVRPHLRTGFSASRPRAVRRNAQKAYSYL